MMLYNYETLAAMMKDTWGEPSLNSLTVTIGEFVDRLRADEGFLILGILVGTKLCCERWSWGWTIDGVILGENPIAGEEPFDWRI